MLDLVGWRSQGGFVFGKWCVGGGAYGESLSARQSLLRRRRRRRRRLWSRFLPRFAVGWLRFLCFDFAFGDGDSGDEVRT